MELKYGGRGGHSYVSTDDGVASILRVFNTTSHHSHASCSQSAWVGGVRKTYKNDYKKCKSPLP